MWIDKVGGVMNSLVKLFQRQLRRPVRPVYQQLELPLGGIRLGKEDWRTVGELQKIRRELAAL